MTFSSRLLLSAFVVMTSVVCHALTIPGADGSDGPLHITTKDCTNGVFTINLGRAATDQWDAPPKTAGCGVYDPEKWAVVFKYSSVEIDKGVTLKFKNHPSNPPVYWLVSGNVTINGEINLDGERGQDFRDSGNAVCATPGPGGFAGGLSMTYDSNSGKAYYGGGGYGPGGATSQMLRPFGVDHFSVTGGGASHATMGNSNSDGRESVGYNTSNAGYIYGDETLIPLIGGSGGAGYNGFNYWSYGNGMSMTGGGAGGAGGGAILIASQGTVLLTGIISARGNRGGGFLAFNYFYFYGGSGSGGAVRVLADAIAGSGTIDVSSFGGTSKSIQNEYGLSDYNGIQNLSIGGLGRIRLDSNNITLCKRDFTSWEVKPIIGDSDNVILWADAKITLLTFGGYDLPTDPIYRQSGQNECISFTTAGERELVFRTENIPTDANVVVKVTPYQSGSDYTGSTVVATMDQGGTFASAIWRAMIPLQDSRTTFQVLVSTVSLHD
ncbi:MAG: hypothetical protein J6X55_02950 [Victivallales bacterium]|nr:hypothetical protein [Victivallales bacterium]